MRFRRIILLTSALIVVAAVIWVGLTIHWNMQQPKPEDFARLVNSMREFSRDQAAAGQASSVAMSVPDLVKSGYLSSSDAKIFAGMDVTLTVTGDVNRPENILIQIRLDDGSVIAQRANGAIQDLNK
jgi:uncharacterized protein YpmB